MINGILNIYKERGRTSHDVVGRLRKLTGQKRIGHTGTLDPAAEGVLPVCLGKATRVCSLITDTDKTYRATLLLGVETDTEDTTGVILRRAPAELLSALTEERVVAAIQCFVGKIEQIPPMYSAVSINGKRLYELAREGIVVERKPRPVTIYSIRVLYMELPRVTMEIVCSRGTYIRTLCSDIGKTLGVSGCMEALLRVSAGGFNFKDSFRLSTVKSYIDAGRFSEILIRTDEIFKAYRIVAITGSEYDKLLYNGCPIPTPEEDDGMVRVYDGKGAFIGIYECGNGVCKPVKIFYDKENTESE